MTPPDHRSLRGRLTWFVASLVLVGALAAALWFGRPAPAPDPPPPQPQQPAASQDPPRPLTRDKLGLEDLVAAVNVALQPPLEGDRAPPIFGERFTVALAFGCSGPLAENAPSALGYTYDPVQEAVTLIAQPEDWGRSSLVQSAPESAELEAVEGFWIRPAPAAGDGCASPIAASTQGPRVGVAQLFRSGGSRAERRRERPYRATRKTGGVSVFPSGFRLVLSGRVARAEDGPVIRCGAALSTTEPECLIVVELDRVAFEDASTGEVLASWSA